MCTKNEAFEILASVYASCNQISGGKIHDAILYGSYARGEHVWWRKDTDFGKV